MNNKAKFGIRTASVIIDFLIIISLAFVIGIPLGSKIQSKQQESVKLSEQMSATTTTSTIDAPEEKREVKNPITAAIEAAINNIKNVLAFGIGLVALLYGLIEAFTGASIGKMTLNLKIGNADGSNMTIGLLFRRYFVKNIVWLLFLIGGACGQSFFNAAAMLILLILTIGFFRVLTEKGDSLVDSVAHSSVYIV